MVSMRRPRYKPGETVDQDDRLATVRRTSTIIPSTGGSSTWWRSARPGARKLVCLGYAEQRRRSP